LAAKRLDGIKFRRQEPIGPYIVDFVSFDHKIVIELDGGQHNTETNQVRDGRRSDKLREDGFTILRFWNNDVLENIEGILETIREVASRRDLSPSP
jgi:very-short-patch-repair endonuclease